MGFKNLFRKDPDKVLSDGKINFKYKSDLQTFKDLPNFKLFLDQLTIKHNNQIGLIGEPPESDENGLMAAFHYPIYNLDLKPKLTFFFIIQSVRKENRIAFLGIITDLWDLMGVYNPSKTDAVYSFGESYCDFEVSKYAIHHEEIYNKAFSIKGLDIRNYTRQGSNFLAQFESQIRNYG